MFVVGIWLIFKFIYTTTGPTGTMRNMLKNTKTYSSSWSPPWGHWAARVWESYLYVESLPEFDAPVRDQHSTFEPLQPWSCLCLGWQFKVLSWINSNKNIVTLLKFIVDRVEHLEFGLQTKILTNIFTKIHDNLVWKAWVMVPATLINSVVYSSDAFKDRHSVYVFGFIINNTCL